ncbi:Maf family protein [Marinomonas dokdonensis]|uniref:Maf family protein n=1 Tax=Marinomonas dokdonensis TaxID=328224 RepID=UPI0040557902
MIVLASASPRRKELLSLIVPSFDVLPADIDETPIKGEAAEAYVLRMAKEKARASLERYKQTNGVAQKTVFIASDTSVVIEGEILGKPQDLAEAKIMLRKLSGRSHQVMTSVCLCDQNLDQLVAENIVTQVSFRSISDVEIEQYWRSGEPVDKAGSYAIQGLGALFVTHMSGSYSAVVGLPLYETSQLLTQFGIQSLEEMCHE